MVEIPNVLESSCAAAIVGTGTAFPSRVMPADWPGGDGTRYWCAPHESTVDLAEQAVHAALDDAGVALDAIDLLVVTTDTPEFIVPSTAVVLQARLGVSGIVALEVGASGDGFLPAFVVAARLVSTMPPGRRAVVVGVSCISKYLDPHDEHTAPIFGDGAGALVLEHRNTSDVLAFEIRSTSAALPGLGIFAGGARTPVTHAIIDAGIQTRLRWSGAMPREFPVHEAVQRIENTLGGAGVRRDEVGAWIWAQAYEASVGAITAALGVDDGSVHTSTHDYGFTGPACLPITLHEARQRGLVAPGALVVLAGAGTGRDVCVAVVRMPGDASVAHAAG